MMKALRGEVNKMYFLTAILGFSLLIAPFLVGYAQNTLATLTSIVAGSIVVVMSGLEAVNHERQKWEYAVALILGLVTVVSPFVFGFSGHTQALWTLVFLGTLIAITAGSKIYTVQFHKQ